MTATVLTVTEVNQNFSRARHAVAGGPVVITERGKPALVLMTYEAFKAHEMPRATLLERIDVPGTELIELDPLRPESAFRPADLG